MTILGSRRHFCIHKTVRNLQGPVQDAACRSITERNRCIFDMGLVYLRRRLNIGLMDPLSTASLHLPDVIDIEDIVDYGLKNTACPYFISRQMHETAQLVLLPYNYLIDRLRAKRMGVDIPSSVMIIDEGHNIEDSLCEASSFEFTSEDLSDCIIELDVIIQYFSIFIAPFQSQQSSLHSQGKPTVVNEVGTPALSD